jgi:hypothetical protein
MIFLWIYQKKRPLARAWLGSALLSALTLMSPLVFADYDKAVEYYDSGQLQEAFAEWQADAYAGNSIAQRKLGLMYLHGESVPQDTTKGVFWLTRAAEQKDSYAALVLSAINDKDNKDNKDNKDDKGRNLGLSSYALSLAYDSGPDDDFTGFALTGSYATSDNIRYKLSIYSLEHSFNSDLKIDGFAYSYHGGKGFMSQGFGFYGNFGFYLENWELGTFDSYFTGYELGGGIFYNWSDVSVDWNLLNFRSSWGEYEELAGVSVTALSISLGISTRF